jgi:hypothetical protein
MTEDERIEAVVAALSELDYRTRLSHRRFGKAILQNVQAIGCSDRRERKQYSQGYIRRRIQVYFASKHDAARIA